MKTKGKVFLACFFIIIILVLTAGFIYIKSQISPVKNENESETVRIEIQKGDSTYKIAQKLEEAGLIKNQKFFYYSVRYPQILNFLYPNDKIEEPIVLKSGIYHINFGLNFAQLINALSSGQQEYIRVSIPEGKTISQIGEILENANICSKDQFKQVCHSQELLKKYNIPGESAEGFLFPETYFFTTGMTAQEVAFLMIDTFFEKIQTIEGLSEKTPAELYDIVILASIVEREYRVEEEAPLIASVFTNRLKQNIGLYSCATIVYILTEIEGRPHPDRILLEDTKIDSPYNTYKWAGLTPGPISNPGLVSLSAAANPPKTNYYFFQVSDASQGKHVFTSTFDEHKASHNLSTKN
jgi:UPF0755 protein